MEQQAVRLQAGGVVGVGLVVRAGVAVAEDDAAAPEEHVALAEVQVAHVGRQVRPARPLGVGRGVVRVEAHVAEGTAEADHIRGFHCPRPVEVFLHARERECPVRLLGALPAFFGGVVKLWVFELAQADDAGRLAVLGMLARIGVVQVAAAGIVGVRVVLARLALEGLGLTLPGVQAQPGFRVGIRGRLEVGLVDEAVFLEALVAVARVEQAQQLDGHWHGLLAAQDRCQAEELLVAAGPEDPGVASEALVGGPGLPQVVGAVVPEAVQAFEPRVVGRGWGRDLRRGRGLRRGRELERGRRPPPGRRTGARAAVADARSHDGDAQEKDGCCG